MSYKNEDSEDLNAAKGKIFVALSSFLDDATSRGWIKAKDALDAAVTESTDCYASAVAARFKVKSAAPLVKGTSLNVKATGGRAHLQKKGSTANFSPVQTIQPIRLDKLFMAHQVKPDQIFNQTSSVEEIETVLKERVKLYEYKDGIWVELDSNHNQGKRHFNNLQLNKHNGKHTTYSLSIGYAGRVRVWCSMKGMVFEKGQQGKISCGIIFAVPLDDEAKENAAEGKVSKQFAIKVNAKRVDGLLETLNSVAKNGTLMKQHDNHASSDGTLSDDIINNSITEKDDMNMNEKRLYKFKARPVRVTDEEPEDNFTCFVLDKHNHSTVYAEQFDEGTLELRSNSSGKHRLVWYDNNATDGVVLTWEEIEGREVAVQDFNITPAYGTECIVRFVAILMKERITSDYYMIRLRSTEVVVKLYNKLKEVGMVDMKPHRGLSEVSREV
eukprot:scaffold557_cov75-Cyclotella_meneghiniana.AAC.13